MLYICTCSYTGLMDFVDAQFPPVVDPEKEPGSEEPQSTESAEEFSTFNYWRQPVGTDELFARAS